MLTFVSMTDGKFKERFPLFRTPAHTGMTT